MKRIFYLLFALLVLAACVPTPKEDAVKQKNTNVLIDSVVQEQQKLTEIAATMPPVKIEVPERFQCDFALDSGARVIADVPIRVLTDGSFPVLRVERRMLNRDERMSLIRQLLQTDGALYRQHDVYTRASIERILKGLMEEPTEEFKRDYMQDRPESDWAEYLQARQEDIAYWQERYRSAGDDPAPYDEWDGKLPLGGADVYEQQQYDIVADPEPRPKIECAVASVYAEEHDCQVRFRMPWNDDTGITSIGCFDNNANRPKTGTERIAPEDYAKVHEDASVSASQAIETVLSLMDGFADLAVNSVYWSHNADSDGDNAGRIGLWAYLIRLTPVYDGAFGAYCTATSRGTQSEREVMRPWRYESVCAAVAPDGTLLSLKWEGGLKVTETVVTSTKLLPYDEIVSIFRKYMNRLGWNEHYIFTVDDVQLGLFRIREQNSPDTGLLVPVWFFTGSQVDDRDGWTGHWDAMGPLCIINAIDGSIIDVHKGY